MSIMMYVSSRKFAQYSNATFSYIDFGYVDYNELEESDIVYGRLPQNNALSGNINQGRSGPQVNSDIICKHLDIPSFRCSFGRRGDLSHL